jgi:aspartyl-tRNA(Asn)/glutamyl-tRNA(Gln) amidotransferase subunit C
MPSLPRTEVEHIAALARLELAEDEVTLYAQQLGKVLDHFASMAKVDTADVPPTVSPQHVVEERGAGLRSDVARPSLDREEALRPAPDFVDGYFRVPRMSDDTP